MNSLSIPGFGVGLILAAGIYQQVQAQTQQPKVTEILVKGQQLDRVEQPYSSTYFDNQTVRDLAISQPETLFDKVPGMNIRDLGLSGVANSITIRGFGGGGHGGDLGVVLDGIALNEAMSHADGYVDLNVIVPLEIDSFTVYKGPVSALYGNYNRGGLLKVNTRKSGEYTNLDVSAGSHGRFDLQGASGHNLGESQSLNLAAQHYRSDGYRPQSATERTTLAGRWGVRLGANTQVALSARWHDADGDNPSYLSEEQYPVDPYGIDPNVRNDGSEKTFATARADLNHSLGDTIRWLSYVYTTQQEFSRWFTRPVGGQWQQREETYDRDVEGAGSSFNGQNRLGATELTWVAGVELLRESTYFQYYEGLDNRQRQAPAVADRDVSQNSRSAFIELHADVHRLLMPSLGLRYDRFDGKCRLVGPETGGNPCESLNELDNLSPKLGIKSAWLDGVQTRVSLAEGFALPGGWLKYQSQAANLEPVVYRQGEIGLTVSPSESLEVDWAYYQLDSSGEVRTLAPGEFENYDKTERTGWELSFTWLPLADLTLTSVYSETDSAIKTSDNPAQIGNPVGGVADYMASASATWQFLSAWQFDLNWRGVGGYALSAADDRRSDSYALLGAGIAYQHSGAFDYQAYLKIDNLTDKVYAASHSGLGYATGAPRQLRAGIQFNL